MKDGRVEIWDLSALSLKQTIQHTFPNEIVKRVEEKSLLPYYVGGMKFSPDSSQIAVGYLDGKIELWTIVGTTATTVLAHDFLALSQSDSGLYFHLAFTPGGKDLVAFKHKSKFRANHITIWSLPDAELISVSEAGMFYQIAEPAYLPDAKTLLVYSEEESNLFLNLWDIETGNRSGKFGLGLAEIDSMTVVSDGSQAVIHGYDVQDNYYRQVRKVPEGNLLESAAMDTVSEDQDLVDFRELLIEQGHYETSWAKDGSPVVAQLSSSEDHSFTMLGNSHWVRFPDVAPLSVNLPDDASQTYLDPDGEYLAWCTRGAISFLAADGSARTVDVPASPKCDVLTVSSQENYAAVWHADHLNLINLETGTANRLMLDRIYSGDFLTAAFSRDENLLFSSDGPFTVWQLNPLTKLARSEVGTMNSGNSIDFAVSENNDYVASLSGTLNSERASMLMHWRTKDASPVKWISAPYVNGNQPKFISIVISQDGQLIASGDDFGRIRFWSPQTGEELAFYEMQSDPLDMIFTPDGSGLLVVLRDGTIRLLGVP